MSARQTELYASFSIDAHNHSVPVTTETLFSDPRAFAAFDIVRLSGKYNPYMDWQKVLYYTGMVLTVLHEHTLANRVVDILSDRQKTILSLRQVQSTPQDIRDAAKLYIDTIPVLGQSDDDAPRKMVNRRVEWKSHNNNVYRGFVDAVTQYIDALSEVAIAEMGDMIAALGTGDEWTSRMHTIQLASTLEGYGNGPKNPLHIV